MIRLSSLRLAASLFAFSTLALTVAPADAQVAPPEASYASVLRTLNPHLTLDKARSYARSVLANAMRTKLDPRFIMSIVTVESRWHANAVSRVGARGLGQLMPGTARMLGVNAWNPAENLRGTSKYLKALVSHFAGKPNAMRLAIASYNAGPKAVERYHGVPPYAETQRYVVKVLRVWKTLDGRVGNAFRVAHPHAAPAIAESTPVNPFLTDGPLVAPGAPGAAAIVPAAASLVPVSAPAAGEPDASAAAPASAPAAAASAPTAAGSPGAAPASSAASAVAPAVPADGNPAPAQPAESK